MRDEGPAARTVGSCPDGWTGAHPADKLAHRTSADSAARGRSDRVDSKTMPPSGATRVAMPQGKHPPLFEQAITTPTAGLPGDASAHDSAGRRVTNRYPARSAT